MAVHERIVKLGGCSVIGLVIVALFAFGCAIASAGARDYTAAGVCLIAAAVACGAIANVIYRS